MANFRIGALILINRRNRPINRNSAYSEENIRKAVRLNAAQVQIVADEFHEWRSGNQNT